MKTIDVSIISIGRVQNSKFSKNYQCVKVKDIHTERIYTLNIGSVSSLKFRPYLKKGNVFFGCKENTNRRGVIDIRHGFTRVKQYNNENTEN